MVTIEKCLDVDEKYTSIWLKIGDFGQTFLNFDWILSCVLLLS